MVYPKRMPDLEFVNVHSHPSEVVIELVESGRDIDLEVSTISFERVENGQVQPREEVPPEYEDTVRAELQNAGYTLEG